MSEARILLCGSALDAMESSRRLEMLRYVDLPNATKYVVTTGKFDAQQVAKTFNVEADYPPEPARLRTISGWAEAPVLDDPRFRDGYDLFCLRRILARNSAFEYAVLLRNADGFAESWPDLVSAIEGRPYLTFSKEAADRSGPEAEPNVLFNLEIDSASGLFDLAWELYASGAVYAMSDYSLDGALATALDGATFGLAVGRK